MPGEPPNPTLIFHITHVENLAALLVSGELQAKNTLGERPHTSIANEDIQARRAAKLVTLQPNGNLHDYVPFYFAPRSPMLYCNHHGTIANAKPQGEIIHLVSSAQSIAAAGLPFVFYDRHAVMDYARPFSRLEDLPEVDWRIFQEPPLLSGYAKYWQDRYDAVRPHWMSRKEVRQAEFLVHRAVPFSCIGGIGVFNQQTEAIVRDTLALHRADCGVRVEKDWYY